jgi:eukaryotic-like serine/threonine-protein kinase
MPVTPERWREIERLYHEARERPDDQRARFLAEACVADAALRAEVESMLASEPAAAGFMSTPAVGSGSLIGMTSFVGRQLGPYAIQSPLGAGGMGEVYRARDSKLGRDVAIKILPPSFAANPERLVRFDREARVLASLNHPHIGALYGLENVDGIPALVMELVEGEDLAQRLARGPIPLAEALPMATQIADALEAAHDKGIVHRDLKPANIKITPEGIVKVLDFGLAKPGSGGSGGPGGAGAQNLTNSPTMVTGTREGVILGTAAYMSPEQARGKVVDKRTDIWAFGCVLYEMLTGRAPFPGETLSDTIAAILEREPPWAALPAATPAGIRQLLMRCLAKDPRRRLHDIADARLELDQAQSEPAGDADAGPGPPRNRERFLWAALALATLIGGVAVVRALRPVPLAPEMRLEISTPTTSDPISFAMAPDGRRLAFVASGDGPPRLWVRPLDATTAQPLAGTEGASHPFWSPDGSALGFFADGKLKRIDATGGLPRTLASAQGSRGGTWNRDGTILFAPNKGPIHRVPSSGGEIVAVTTIDPPRQVSHRFPEFLPDGRKFLFFVEGSPETQGIYLGALDSSRTQRLTAADAAGAYLAPGWLLFLRQGTLVARSLDSTRGELTGDPIPVAAPVGLDALLFASALSASGTGIVAYRSGGVGRRQLTWFDRTGKLLGTLGAPDENGLVAPSLSPDGRRVVAHRTAQNNTDIWIFDPARTTRFTFDASRDLFPIWSPDGMHVAFDSNRTGYRHFYQKRSDLAGTEMPLLEGPEEKVLNDWSPDGRFLLYTTPSDPKTGADIWYLPLSGDRQPVAFLRTSSDERAGQFSPDGHWVAYHSNESGSYEIYVRPFPGPGGQWQVSTSGGIQARWSPEGKQLYYIAPDGKLMSSSITVNGAAVEPGVPVALFQTQIWGGGTNATQGQQYDVAPDGRFLINIATEDTSAAPITLLLNWKPRR